MSPRKRKPKKPPRVARPRGSQGRQRQHLIDACISALHLYGPSRTTVAKVVAFAKMSPGIVRFYFDSKAAMLVASLQFLAAEFEERVLVPVAKLKSTPVAALQTLVDLYLDADIASARKVSVWYAFWGEASSRQEYYDICGRQDESFAALVRELVEALIVQSSQLHLDPDGVTLGLIGALEILWQDIAFQTERDIDRPAAKRRGMAYLRSVFPGQFGWQGLGLAQPSDDAQKADAEREPRRFAGWVYANSAIHAQERETLFRGTWAIAGHESEIPRQGEFLAVDVGAERALLVRGPSSAVYALRNCCPVLPHALVAGRHGRFDGGIACSLHGLTFSLAGRSTQGPGRTDLDALDLASAGGLLCVRAPHPQPQPPFDTLESLAAWLDATPVTGGLMLLGAPLEMAVAADWKVVVERWLDLLTVGLPPDAAADSFGWSSAAAGTGGWSARCYRGLMDCGTDSTWRRRVILPNHLLEIRPDGLTVVQALPTAPGRSRLRRLDYTVLPPDDSARAVQYLARRLGPYARRSALDLAESIQTGVVEFGYKAAAGVPEPAAATTWFHRRLAAHIPALALERPPTDY